GKKGGGMDTHSDRDKYARQVADSSYEWYARAAIRSRRLYRASTMTTILTSALIPVSVAIMPGNTTFPAVLGFVVIVSTGLQAAFNWQENYLRFNRAREAVEAERRRYRTAIPPYGA